MKRKQSTQPETLFDDKTFAPDTLRNEGLFDEVIEQIVDTRGFSPDEARRMLGIETPKDDTPEIDDVEPSEGVSVELGTRALALENIMATYNQLNGMIGANITSERANSEFNRRYRHPEEVLYGMGRKAATMLQGNVKDFKALNATDELIEAGYGQEPAEAQERKIGSELLKRFGPGKAYAPERNKVVQKAKRTVRLVSAAVKENKTT